MLALVRAVADLAAAVEADGPLQRYSAQASQVFPTPQGPVISRFRASRIQRPVASCWNSARSSLRGVLKSTSSMAAPMWRSLAERMRVWKRRVLRAAISRVFRHAILTPLGSAAGGGRIVR